MHLKSIALIACSIFFIGCNDNALVTKNKNLTKIPCLSLIEDNSTLNKELSKLYSFKKDCQYKLTLSTNSGISCNSPYNASKKATTNFPSSFIELDVKDGFKIIYTYYKDLTEKPNINDLEKAFERLKSDLL